MRSLRKVSIGLGLAVLLASLSPAAHAGSIVHQASISLSPTNWYLTMTFPKFHMDAACLDSICFSLAGHVEGSAKFESLDSDPATVTMDLAATIDLQRPNGSPLVTVIPLVHSVDNVTAFDGTIDFGGTSGRTYAGLSGDDTDALCTTDPADFALFTGPGDIVLPTNAVGSSSGSGAGNLLLQFSTSASSSATVTYFFHCPTSTRETSWGSVKSLFR
jgi:hypothetical protein